MSEKAYTDDQAEPSSSCCAWWRPQDDWRMACGCIPLAAAALIICFSLGGLASWNIYRAVTTERWPDWITILRLVVGCLKLFSVMVALASVTGAVASIRRRYESSDKPLNKPMRYPLTAIHTFLLMWTIGLYALIWVQFGLDLADGWRPTNEDVLRLVLVNSIYLCIFAFIYWQASVMASLQRTILAGGSGWDYKNTTDLEIGQISCVSSKSQESTLSNDHSQDSTRYSYAIPAASSLPTV